MNAMNKRRGAKWWVALTVLLLVCLFVIASNSVWRDNPTINLLGTVALIPMLILMPTVLVGFGRRGTDARANRTEGLQAIRRPNRGTRTIGIVLVVVGIVLITMGVVSFSNSSPMLGLGLAAAITGIILVRDSFGRVHSPGATRGEGAVPKPVSRFERFMRKVGIALVPLSMLSFASLFLYGYHTAWPLYTFVGIVLVSLLVWPYLIGRAYIRWLTR